MVSEGEEQKHTHHRANATGKKMLHARQKIWTANSRKLKSFSLPKNTTSRLQPLDK